MKIPVIASLNGITKGGWLRYAKQMEQAGADALELNIYYIPVDPDVTGEQVEQQLLRAGAGRQAEVRIPVAVKLGPYFSSMANMARKLDAAGADGLVLFNRFYQPDFDLEALEVVPNLILSNSHELLLRLHWIAVLYGSVKADMALTGGVHTATDVVKAMMAGAKVAMMTSALLKRGISYLDTLAHRAADLDGRARIRFHPADAGQHEPQRRAAARGVRARQLHEGAQLLRHAVKSSNPQTATSTCEASSSFGCACGRARLSAAFLDNSRSARESTGADSPPKSTVSLRSHADVKVQARNGGHNIDTYWFNADLVKHFWLGEVGRLKTFERCAEPRQSV